MLYWKFLAEGGTVVGNPGLGGGEENPPARDTSTGAPCPQGLRNAFTFSRYYSLTIKIKTNFVLGFVTILALFILSTSGNGLLRPRAAFLVELTRGVFLPSLQVAGALHTHPAIVELPWFPTRLGAAPWGTAHPLPASHLAFVQRKLPEP